MTAKTKIFSLLVLILLFLPIVINPQRSGQVLGTSETEEQSSFFNFQQNNQEAVVPAQSEIASRTGGIASGVRTTPNDSPIDTNEVFVGKAIVNMNTSLVATSDKFPLGTSVKVRSGDIDINIVIQGRSVLSGDTLLVLNQETFEKLGGNPSEGSVDIQVTIN
jgi:hypothetical protein